MWRVWLRREMGKKVELGEKEHGVEEVFVRKGEGEALGKEGGGERKVRGRGGEGWREWRRGGEERKRMSGTERGGRRTPTLDISILVYFYIILCLPTAFCCYYSFFK